LKGEAHALRLFRLWIDSDGGGDVRQKAHREHSKCVNKTHDWRTFNDHRLSGTALDAIEKFNKKKEAAAVK
jgi:hypothetical protein